MPVASGHCFYFGTFNPIHSGHLMVAQSALNQFGPLVGFDQVTFVPAGNPPHRHTETDLLDAALRLKMVELATADNPAFTVSDIEMKRPGKSYTVETLQALIQQHNLPTPVPLIIGADALAQLGSWHQPAQLIAIAHFLQAPRPGYEPVREIQYQGHAIPLSSTPIDMPELAISSSRIRQTIRESGPQAAQRLRYYLPSSVADFIQWNRLYTPTSPHKNDSPA